MTEPAGMLETLALAGDDDLQTRLATELGLSPAPSAESVLEAIGAHHPVRPVAKRRAKPCSCGARAPLPAISNGVRLPGLRGGLPVGNRRAAQVRRPVSGLVDHATGAGLDLAA